MTCLPFGLATAPYIFAKITNWVANFFRERGIRIVVYLDDFLLLHQNPSILTQQCQFVQTHLLEMGWCINYRKSTLSPSRIVEYLGIIWDTEQNIKRLPKEKIQKCANLIETTLANRHWSWWLAKVLLENLNFASSIVSLGRLHCRLIQIAANKLPMEQRHKKFQLSEHVIAELQWWIKNIAPSSPIHQKGATIFITTDAAKKGWGATVGNTQLSGLWSKEQIGWHSNGKELVAVLKYSSVKVIKRVGHLMRDQSVMIQSDNRSVVAYITKQGGTQSLGLLHITQNILNLARKYRITLVARYLPGKYNLSADSLSRLKELPEWSLSLKICQRIFNLWGKPEVDLFASARSAVVPLYVCEDVRDKDCLFVDAFSQYWNFKIGWLFPPPALIPRVLRHLTHCSGIYLLVVPK